MVNTVEKEWSVVVGGPDQPGDILRDGEELAERWGKDILGEGTTSSNAQKSIVAKSIARPQM